MPEAASRIIEKIEGPQQPDRQGYDPYSLADLMDRYHVPGVSIAVIHDFAIHWC